MHKGISVWLDVPVEALAQRIAAVGTNSRPLLHYEAGDAYTRVSYISSIKSIFLLETQYVNYLGFRSPNASN